MNIKKIMEKNSIRNVDIATHLNMEPSRVSLCVNGVRPWPKAKVEVLARLLGVDRSLFSKGGNKNVSK